MDAQALIGTWKMISWTRRVVATGEVSDAMGADPVGYIAYQPDGRMMAFVANRQRPAGRREGYSDADKATLFDTMLAYTATYTLEGDRVVHHVDAAWDPAWQEDQIRPIRLEGDRLVIHNAPGKDLLSSQDVIFRLEFRKL
ncbi:MULTISPECIES: lipocalin-like domain-containing protein [unclassified Rhizobium]|jgi:hypothetical protein|uniref:lipocalin-like domain-containing protein n=1 Tax=Rhizobium sp. BG4 TaxID=2613770 RepID=UPI001028F28E|nr:lipocalin-like domain-containing protein [Rhizobium sp. BG4]QRM42142.1 lipocalin-like domain-containing protein [Rhizobium sp. BG4]